MGYNYTVILNTNNRQVFFAFKKRGVAYEGITFRE
jgi:hypothetical protein